MFFRTDRRRVRRVVSNLVGEGTLITGTIQFSGDMHVDGEVRGDVRSAGDQTGMLILGNSAQVDGNVDVGRLIVRGKIKGKINASEFVRIHSNARIDCDLQYAAVEVHSGAVVLGRLIPAQQTAQVAEPPTPIAIRAEPPKKATDLA